MNATKRKQAYIPSQLESIQEWKQQMIDMELYDPQYEEVWTYSSCRKNISSKKSI